ncbi:hypothetical protein [Pseudomonas phage 98PfluR60PP]|uniref:Uncharacterized protein n=1 Tax=Pseudomonas phage 98PfluR60PP TaxID=2163965 RepID=A0A2S1PFY1_9CAUD|nr:hypothetical protein PP760_gp42 [Pseudomonas phage 98PfluR60PP]AWH15474.1 hypothetical protein [Pseudomonas phage 98PfluR60PP]
MSDTREGMLPGDEFSLKEWQAAQSKPKSNGVFTVEMQQAFDKLKEITAAGGVPMFTVFADSVGVAVQGDLLDKPENVSAEMLMARAMLSNDPNHVMGIAMAQMQGMKP